MRAVPTDLLGRIESGAASLCHVWILTRTDGAVLGFTDHDRDLVVDGVTCRAASGWTAGAAETAAGFSPGMAAAVGGFDDAGLTEADLAAGLYDGARVECRWVDWSASSLFVRLWRASVAAARTEGGAFTLELEGPLAALDRVVGRTFARSCDAAFGDVRCGIDPAAFPGATCDKRWATCRTVFGNELNFRGFPTAPGEDFLTLYPSEGDRNDGGRR
uniref:Bacteriophage phiJL001 Gp84 C-terminal domain-containing protein n=1 Tax=Caulobacter sp. (strain K31) TaxID=366602 RepID=B0SVY4_CAUSK